MSRVIEGNLVAPAGNFAICVSRFNHLVTDELLQGAVDCFHRHGVDDDRIEIYKVPGAFELPALARWVADLDAHVGIVCLGAVIRGSTPHFEHVARECSSGIGAVARQARIPVTFGVLTCDTIEQALERAGIKAGNKGADAAAACIELANLRAKIVSAGAEGRLKPMVMRKGGKEQ